MQRAILCGLLTLSAGIFFVSAASAQSPSSTKPLLQPCDVIDRTGTPTITPGTECTLAHFFNQFVVLAQWGLSLVLLLGLLMMIYGGFSWITAAGRASKIDEGKRVIIGTLVGLAISFSGYVIINFTIAAITGTTARSVNPFAGPIATIFGGKEEERPFSGDPSAVSSVENCNTSWDLNCHNYIRCADRSKDTGRIHEFQRKLNEKNCNCGKLDGCYGSGTATCVRRFQIANQLPPTGEIDSVTEGLIDGAGIFCTLDPSDVDGKIATQVNQVNGALPKFSVNDAREGNRSLSGCCVVYGGGENPYFCANDISQRTCMSLGTNNRFVRNAKCLDAVETKTVCGFCHDGADHCFGISTEFWCRNKVTPRQSFSADRAVGSALCETLYIPSLRTIWP